MADKKEDLVKVRVKGESVWAQRLSPTTASIKNIPLDGQINLHDIVEIDADGNYIKTIEQKTNTIFIGYDKGKNETEGRDNFKKLAIYFEENKVEVEGALPGVAGLAIPVNLEFEKFVEIAEKCPVSNGPLSNE